MALILIGLIDNILLLYSSVYSCFHQLCLWPLSDMHLHVHFQAIPVFACFLIFEQLTSGPLFGSKLSATKWRWCESGKLFLITIVCFLRKEWEKMLERILFSHGLLVQGLLIFGMTAKLQQKDSLRPWW